MVHFLPLHPYLLDSCTGNISIDELLTALGSKCGELPSKLIEMAVLSSKVKNQIELSELRKVCCQASQEETDLVALMNGAGEHSSVTGVLLVLDPKFNAGHFGTDDANVLAVSVELIEMCLLILCAG